MQMSHEEEQKLEISSFSKIEYSGRPTEGGPFSSAPCVYVPSENTLEPCSGFWD